MSTFIKTGISGAAMAFAVIASHNALLQISQTVALFASIVVGAFIYGVMVLVLKVDACKSILDMIKQKINRKNKQTI